VKSKSLHVAAAISDARFLAGTHCIEFVWCPEKYEAGDAYGLMQIACCRLRQDPNELPFIVERHRSFGTKLTDPWPRWRAFLGDGVGPHGFYGSRALHLQALLAPARVVALKRNDRVPPEEPAWDPYRRGPKPDRLAKERKAFEEAP
jgi:hypothetical protein